MTKPTRVDYDSVASDYSSRYRRNNYSGVTAAVAEFFANDPVPNRFVALEAGCGTGFWLQAVQQLAARVVGMDLSSGMLHVAQTAAPTALLARARAEALPFQSDSFARIFCINALHHFSDPAMFFLEARRVAQADGAVLTVGLDPHTGQDRWWVYDYFPEALIADRMRYLPAHAIRELMAAVGFERCETRELQHLPRQLSIDEAERDGFLARTSTSQLMVISDEEYRSGIARIRGDAAEHGDSFLLRADLRLYGTTGWLAA